MTNYFKNRKRFLLDAYEELIIRKNQPVQSTNGIYEKYLYPILTADHAPLNWRFDFNPATNPYLLERFGINAVFNSGAIKFENKYVLVARVEGKDRKSFFAIAESDNGISNFRFWDAPVQMPRLTEPDVNVYDMRLVSHEDGWIYGLFCTERRDTNAPEGDQSAAIAQCGIARTKDLIKWQRLPDLKTPSPQQRNVVLHPEFVNNKYAFYTRPQDSFIEAGSGGGIGFGTCDDIENAVIDKEIVIDKKAYHTVYEAKNGLGPAPFKTEKGWLHLAHGVRNTAAGLRYVLYLFMTDLKDVTKIIHKPAGYFMAPEGEEMTGDVSNVVFSNGWIADDDGCVFIYYASSDVRMHVAVSSIDKLLDYVINTAEDGLQSSASVNAVMNIINYNKANISSQIEKELVFNNYKLESKLSIVAKMEETLIQYKQELEQELSDILAFWMKFTPDNENGGFYGRIDNQNYVYKDAPKGAVLNSRILWTFSAAYNLTKNVAYLRTAERAFDYISEHFIDPEFGGVYWSVNHKGSALDTKSKCMPCRSRCMA